jgi:thiosulfate/3-mercaptopyruvate sulfurtransferase
MSPVVVESSWLARHLGDDDLVVCDVRSVMAHHDPRGAYLQGHLPGALFVDLDEVLADPPGGTAGRHPLPSPERFAAGLGRLGVGDEVTVVAYDDRAGAFASRLVWMLRILGQDARLLDGGLAAWTGPLETDDVVRAPVERTVRAWPAAELADADDVAAHLAAGGVVVDARDPARFRGEHEPIDRVAGHVPGAINRCFGDHLVDGRFRSVDDIRASLAPLAGDPLAVVYCGSGVTACHDALAAEHAGLHRPRVYVGSWSGWTADPSRPVATGDA